MIGQTLNNRYEVVSRLGKGAMGVVYRAADKQTGRDVALKVISSDLAIDPDMLERFKREGEALRQLRHPNIVEFLDAFQHDDHYVIVMEYVSGGSLHDLISKGLLPIDRVSRIALELCDALIRSHHLNIIHRDLKPENVLIAEDGTPKLADFGVARLSEGTRMTRSGTQVGTPYYMAPEAWEGKMLDAQADIWSLGVVLFEMLTGQVPFGGDTGAAVMNKVLTTVPPDLKKLRSDIPGGMAKIVTRMLTRDKNRRYQTMRQVAVDLESNQGRTPQPTRRPSTSRLPIVMLGLIGLGAMLLLGVLVAANLSSIREALSPASSSPSDLAPTKPAVDSSPTQQLSSSDPDGLWLEVLNKGYLLIATDPDYAPQSFLDPQGTRPPDTKCPSDALTSTELQGFDIDVAREISNSLGVEACFVSPSWDQITAGGWSDGWDISVGSMTITTLRQQVLDFSEPYYFIASVVAVYENSDALTLSDIADKVLCVVEGTNSQIWVEHSDLGLPATSIYFNAPESIKSFALESDRGCAEDVVALRGVKSVVGYVTSQTVLNAHIGEGLAVRQLGTPVFSEDLAVAFDKQSAYPTESLRNKVDEIILELHANGKLSAFSNRWFGADLTQPPSARDISGTDCSSPEVFCVGLVTDGGSINDNGFNQDAWAGLQRAEQELGAVIQFVVPADSNEYANKIAEFGDADYDVIVTTTFALGEATIAAASTYPDVDFIGVDQFQAESTDGVAGLGFPEDQAGFLVGALAAMMSESHMVGALCGTDVVPPVWRYGEGYKAGVTYADSLNGTATAVFVDYHSDVDISKAFTDPEWGADTATAMIAGGADIIFGCGGETGNAAVIAASQAGAYGIGVDVDQYYSLPDAAPRILSSALKLITPGVFELIQSSQEGTFPSGNVLGGAGYAPFHDLDDAVSADTKAIMEKILADITSGAIQTNVPASKP